MGGELLGGTVDRVALLARQLELTARLEGDRRLPPLERDQVLTLETRRPPETVGENQVLSNRDKKQHSEGRGQDSKDVQNEQLQDNAANRLSE